MDEELQAEKLVYVPIEEEVSERTEILELPSDPAAEQGRWIKAKAGRLQKHYDTYNKPLWASELKAIPLDYKGAPTFDKLVGYVEASLLHPLAVAAVAEHKFAAVTAPFIHPALEQWLEPPIADYGPVVNKDHREFQYGAHWIRYLRILQLWAEKTMRPLSGVETTHPTAKIVLYAVDLFGKSLSITVNDVRMNHNWKLLTAPKGAVKNKEKATAELEAGSPVEAATTTGDGPKAYARASTPTTEVKRMSISDDNPDVIVEDEYFVGEDIEEAIASGVLKSTVSQTGNEPSSTSEPEEEIKEAKKPTPKRKRRRRRRRRFRGERGVTSSETGTSSETSSGSSSAKASSKQSSSPYESAGEGASVAPPEDDLIQACLEESMEKPRLPPDEEEWQEQTPSCRRRASTPEDVHMDSNTETAPAELTAGDVSPIKADEDKLLDAPVEETPVEEDLTEEATEDISEEVIDATALDRVVSSSRTRGESPAGSYFVFDTVSRTGATASEHPAPGMPEPPVSGITRTRTIMQTNLDDEGNLTGMTTKTVSHSTMESRTGVKAETLLQSQVTMPLVVSSDPKEAKKQHQ